MSSKTINQALQQWTAQYLEEVGSQAEVCQHALQLAIEMAAGNQLALAHLLELLKVLNRLNPDPQTVCSAMLYCPYALLDANFPEQLPEPIREQLDELLKLHQMESQQLESSTRRNAEGLRRLLLALVEDVRVVLIALAWQLVQLRLCKKEQGGRRQQLAEETLLIHAPLANRLGVWQLKWELEDLSFRYTQPQDYHRIAALVAENREARERHIKQFIQALTDVLEQAGIKAEVKGRAKHIFSIWRKMQRKGLDYHELFDVRAVRVLVDDIPGCYSVLGLVHTHWQPVPGEFDDYITTPKGNQYQSLHTAVIDEDGKSVEVQIRTGKMHEHAELGVAAHWRYKEGGPEDPGFDRKVTVMRQLLDSGEDRLDDDSLLDSFQNVTAEDRVYALTPNGDVIDLTAGATVLDFAYHVHTEVGHRCRGAKINGRIVQLTQSVETGDRVEILTGKQPRPSRDWLNPRLGYIKGARARSKVRQWFRKANYDQNLQAGRDMLNAELSRLGLDESMPDNVLQRFHLNRIEDIYVALGNGDLTVTQVVQAKERELRPDSISLLTERKRQKPLPAKVGADDVIIEGVGNLLTSMAGCCQPLPGDPIRGYITRGRGISIHRSDCKHLLNLENQHPRRTIEVNWGSPQQDYPVKLRIDAYDRKALIKDISTVLAAENVGVIDLTSHLDPSSELVRLKLTIRIRDLGQLSGLLSKLGSVSNVQDARRIV